MGIKVLPPDVNQSIGTFTAVGDDIRFGLEAIRNVGKNVVEGIVVQRREKKFESFQDFLTSVPSHAATKRVVESLIKAGAFDSLGHTRRSLIAIHEEAIDASAVLKRQASSGQVDLFGGMFDEDPAIVPIPDLPEWTKRDLLAHEREMLGLYVSDHPLAGQEALLLRHSDMGTIALKESQISDGETVTVAGLITQVQHKVARTSGNPYGQVVLEDFSGEISIMFMGKTYLENRELLSPDQTVSIRGRVSRRDEEVMLQAFSIDVLEAGREQGGVLVVTVREAMATKNRLQKLSEILTLHPGPVEVQIKLVNGGESRHFLLPQRVAVGHDLFGEIKALMGQDSVN
jgi:DNA polymerase-3 subunit alpha